MRQLRRRWFPSIKLRPDENACLRLVQSVGLLQRLPPPHQLTLARALQLHREGPWCTFQSSDQPATHISIIVSGQVGVYRRLPSGRRCRVQLLGENDLLGLHAVADQLKPDFFYRSLTPTVLLRFEWAMAVQYILPRFEVAVLATHVLKVPYLRRVSLCRQWPLAMVERFAELCRLVDYAPGKVIVREGFYYDNFFILYEGEALAQSMGRPIGKVRPGDFVGEIGLLQHSPATAQVLSVDGARGLCISRLEFMSFVTRNYEVALELERVSSRRLGHPIFPLTPGDFRSI